MTHMPERSPLGELLRAYRGEVSQAELAARTDGKVSDSYIGRLERPGDARVTASVEALEAIAEALGLSAAKTERLFKAAGKQRRETSSLADRVGELEQRFARIEALLEELSRPSRSPVRQRAR